jgi:hypothetical protein
MFRKIAIALVAASALAAPVLAQQTSPSGETKLSPSTPSPTVSSTEKSDKLTATKPTTKHRMVSRHHHHVTKMVKSTKYQGSKKYGKYGKSTRHLGRTHKHAYGAVSAKAISSKPAAKSSLKPAAKRSLD